MIVRISAGLSEVCGSCSTRIQKDEIVCLLTSAMKKRCANCAGLSKEQQEKYYSDIVIQGERELDVAPKKSPSFSFRKSVAAAFDTLPQRVRDQHMRSLMERASE